MKRRRTTKGRRIKLDSLVYKRVREELTWQEEEGNGARERETGGRARGEQIIGDLKRIRLKRIRKSKHG